VCGELVFGRYFAGKCQGGFVDAFAEFGGEFAGGYLPMSVEHATGLVVAVDSPGISLLL
jgi:hypothetical protein